MSVNDVDPGFASASPLIRGHFVVAAGQTTQTVVDAVIDNICAVLGPDTQNIGLRLYASEGGNPGKEVSEYGYGSGASEVCKENS